METLGISDAKTDAIFVPVEWREHPRPITLRPPIERQSEPANSISNPSPWSVALGPWPFFCLHGH